MWCRCGSRYIGIPRDAKKNFPSSHFPLFQFVCLRSETVRRVCVCERRADRCPRNATSLSAFLLYTRHSPWERRETHRLIYLDDLWSDKRAFFSSLRSFFSITRALTATFGARPKSPANKVHIIYIYCLVDFYREIEWIFERTAIHANHIAQYAITQKLHYIIYESLSMLQRSISKFHVWKYNDFPIWIYERHGIRLLSLSQLRPRNYISRLVIFIDFVDCPSRSCIVYLWNFNNK